jgi:outer membrane receptor protein involved in Fe transport
MRNSHGWGVRVAVVCAVLMAMAAIAGTANAQTFRGTIQGSVTDTTGASVPGAKVTVRNVDTGITRTTETNAEGEFNVPELQIGAYTVTIEKSGFQAAVTTGVQVVAATESRVDAVLKAGEVTQQVTVSAETLPQVETTSNTLGGTLTSDHMSNLPINGRDYTKLIFLNPGIAGSPDQITDSPGSFGVFSVNGARGRANNFLLDGTDMNDGYHNIPALNQGGVFAVPSSLLPVDAIAELRVLSNYEAEYGRNAGGIILFVTKSGTNDFHGTGLEYFRNNALDARNFFNPGGPGGQPQAPFHNNQFGGSVGGPIIHGQTFFYADYEGQREKGGSVSLDCVPVGSAADGSLAPSDSSNPVIQGLLARHPWPAPNLGGTCTPTHQNASVITPFDNRVDSVIAKIDHSINQSNLLTGRYYYGNSLQDFPLALSPTGGQLPGFDTQTPTSVHLVSLSLVTTFSPTKVNEARFGWNRFFEAFYPQDKSFHPSSIGLCAASSIAECAGAGPMDSGLPVIQVGGGFSQLGATASDTRRRVDTNWQAFDNFSWTLGRHSIKMGYEYRRTTIATNVNSHFRGVVAFASLNDFLQGNITGSSNQSSGNGNRNTFQNSDGLYIQDNFRITSRLTLNAGLRWDYSGVIGEKRNLASECVITAGPTCTLTQIGTNGLSGGLYQPDYKNFAPRLSVAYDLFGSSKTVVRAGWGMFYDSLYHSFFITNSVNNSVFAYGPLFNPFGPAPIITTGLAVTGAVGTCAGPSCLVPGSPVFAMPGAPAGDITTVDRNLRTPYMGNYNFNIEQQLASKVVLQVGYVGSEGHHLLRFRDINQPSAAAIHSADTGTNTIPRVFTVVPSSTGAFYINQDEASANSNYNSLQTSLRVNGWHGLTTAANFVWSHSIDNASDGADFVPNGSQPNDSTRPNLERANSNFDIRRRFTWNYVYQFPNRNGSWSKLTDGWGLDGLMTLQDGQPFQLNFPFNGDFDGSGEFFARPDVVGPIQINSSNPLVFLNLSSFAEPCTVNVMGVCEAGTRHFGNMGRDSLRGPSFKQVDFSVFKDTKVAEKLTMQLRVEIFNIFNHPNFANPFLPSGIAAAGTSGFLPITTTADVGPGNPFLGGGAPRGIQLAAKLVF